MRLPTQFRLRRLILDVVSDRGGVTSEESQSVIRRRLRLTPEQLAVRAGNGYGRFKNDHAFALVALGLDGYTAKRGRRDGRDVYTITANGRSLLRRAGKTIPDGKALWKEIDPLDVAAASVEAAATDLSSSGGAPASRGGRRTASRAEVPEEIQDAYETLEALAGNTQHASSPQGWRVSPAERRAIENHAMTVAAKFFEARGYIVADVSATKPYDLVCTRGSSEKRVEVKGTTTGGIGVFLTSGEVDHAATYSDVALFVLTNIRLTMRGTRPVCAGGDEYVLDPWGVKRTDAALRPIMYRYELPDLDA